MEAFRELAKDPAPAFRCKIAAALTSDKRFVARVEHRLRGPAPSSHIAKLKTRLAGASDELVTFYQQHDGGELYRDAMSTVCALELLRASASHPQFRRSC